MKNLIYLTMLIMVALAPTSVSAIPLTSNYGLTSTSIADITGTIVTYDFLYKVTVTSGVTSFAFDSTQGDLIFTAPSSLQGSFSVNPFLAFSHSGNDYWMDYKETITWVPSSVNNLTQTISISGDVDFTYKAGNGGGANELKNISDYLTAQSATVTIPKIVSLTNSPRGADEQISTIPEPASTALLVAGLLGFGVLRRKSTRLNINQWA
jgi:hypothetical protein